jgi:ribulose-phosphate 3-epimerase
MNHLVAPSLLSADFLNLEKDIDMLNRSEADWFHLDVMDGMFVPNISFGPGIISQISKIAKKPLDVHLMINDPDRYLETFVKAGASLISVHYEACIHLNRTISAIRALGVKAGVVLNPHTPVHHLTEVIKLVDFVLLMSVNPGFGGQKFIEGTYAKISSLKNLIREQEATALIEIDGGVDLLNASRLVSLGADILVAGNTVFSSSDPIQTIHQLKLV